MSDTQHDEAVQVADMEDEHDRDRREARELAYHEVSLRAVELLASAQRAADDAVAEAQSYARDLEETAREQYRHILQRAHDAARAATGETAEDGEDGEDGEHAEAAGDCAGTAPSSSTRRPPRPVAGWAGVSWSTSAPTPGSRTRSSRRCSAPSPTSSTAWPTSPTGRRRRPQTWPLATVPTVGSSHEPRRPTLPGTVQAATGRLRTRRRRLSTRAPHHGSLERTRRRRAAGRTHPRTGCVPGRATVVGCSVTRRPTSGSWGAGACGSHRRSSTRWGCRSRSGCSTSAPARET